MVRKGVFFVPISPSFFLVICLFVYVSVDVFAFLLGCWLACLIALPWPVLSVPSYHFFYELVYLPLCMYVCLFVCLSEKVEKVRSEKAQR